MIRSFKLKSHTVTQYAILWYCIMYLIGGSMQSRCALAPILRLAVVFQYPESQAVQNVLTFLGSIYLCVAGFVHFNEVLGLSRLKDPF